MNKLKLNVEEIEVVGFETARLAVDGTAMMEGAQFEISRPSYCMVETCLCEV